MNCPKCGATPTYSGEYGVHFQCDSELLLQYPFVESGTSFREDKCCLYRQLAAVTAERDAARESHDRLLKIAEELVGGTDEYWAETEGAGIVAMAHAAIARHPLWAATAEKRAGE